MGFDARYVSQLDYNFEFIGLEIKGISPDPSDDEVFEFQLATANAAKALGQGDIDPNDQAAVMEFMNNLTREDFKKVNVIIGDAISTMLHQQPSSDELQSISKKSYRHFQAYLGSLMSDIMDPKIVKTAAMKN